jgi:hypothetical protein
MATFLQNELLVLTAVFVLTQDQTLSPRPTGKCQLAKHTASSENSLIEVAV